jgi:hypothetical protein
MRRPEIDAGKAQQGGVSSLPSMMKNGRDRRTSRKRAFGLDPLVPASIWAGTKGPATSPQNGLDARDALVPARKDPLVPV